MAKRLFEEVCDRIRQDIANGKLRPGDKLPPERDLVTELGVGRPVIREALRSLEEAGVLELRRGVTGGAFIKSVDSGTLTRSMTDLIFLGAVSLEDLTEARTCVLAFTAGRAAERGTDADFEALEQHVENIASFFDQMTDAEKVAAVGQFYELLAKAAHNEVLIILIRSLSQIVTEVLFKAHADVIDEVLSSRRRLMQRLRERDVRGAETEVTTHMAKLHRTVIEHAPQLHKLELSTATNSEYFKTIT